MPVKEISSAALLATKNLAGVAPEANLWERCDMFASAKCE